MQIRTCRQTKVITTFFVIQQWWETWGLNTNFLLGVETQQPGADEHRPDCTSCWAASGNSPFRSSTSQEAGDFLGQGKQREKWEHCGDEPAFSSLFWWSGKTFWRGAPPGAALWPEGAPGKVLVLVSWGRNSGWGFGSGCGLTGQSRYTMNSLRAVERELGDFFPL